MVVRRYSETAFAALRVEGGLFPADELVRLTSLTTPKSTEQSEADYGVPKGLKLRDEIGRYWKVAQALWAEFDARRQRTDLDAYAVTVNDFLVPFFRDVLGFSDISQVSAIREGERLFPVGHVARSGRVALVFAPHALDLDRSDSRFGEMVGERTRRRSAFLLGQEYLNASEKTLWAVVSNGLQVRILRDNPSLTRPAYLEADIEEMLAGDLYADFSAFWLLAHASRFGNAGASPTDCALERWRNAGQEAGIRARDRLRDGVANAVRSLGSGFISHPSNSSLRARLSSGALRPQELFQQLLTLVYRIIFLATVEDRRDERGISLVFTPEGTSEARERYLAGYSMTRVRSLAAKRRYYDRYSDLWLSLTLTFAGLARGEPALALPALGGLFATEGCPDLDSAALNNRAVLSAVFELCFFRLPVGLSRVNYRDMGPEELGSIYESLLELVPQVEVVARRFLFVGDDTPADIKGNQRKLTGSYYTPDGLVQELIKSTLDPVIERTVASHRADPVRALLNLAVCDPACGSGHFLLAAARRIADEIAALHAADGNASPADFRHALREVVAHCVYGVDKNPMAVELAKTALWLEAYTPDRPLSFLDHHIRCGDSLLGVLSPAILDKGIPDAALDALSGDDKEAVRKLKAANRLATKALQQLTSGDLFSQQPEMEAARELDALPDDTLTAVERKRELWLERQADAHITLPSRLADTFTAAFLIAKTAVAIDDVPLTGYFWGLIQGHSKNQKLEQNAAEVCRQHQVFHWWLEFPDVYARGGFDVLLGNPPWEVSQFSEEEFFAVRLPSIAALAGESRKREIAKLQNANPTQWGEYSSVKRMYEAINVYFRASGRYPLTAFGKLNTYQLFAETFAQLVRADGRAGFIVPAGIATDDGTKAFFEWLTSSRRLCSLLAFENEEFVFPSVHHAFRFALVTLSGNDTGEATSFVFFARQPEQIYDSRRRFSLTADEIGLINPNSRTCPVFRSQCDAELTKKLYRVAPILIRDLMKREAHLGGGSDDRGIQSANPWGVRFSQGLFNMTGDSALFRGSCASGHLPLYEAKLIHQFDHRWATYDVGEADARDVNDVEKADASFSPRPRYWVEERQVLARTARVPPRVARAWLAEDTEMVVSAVATWVAGYFMNNGGPARVLPGLLETNSLLSRTFATAKDLPKASQVELECPIKDSMVDALRRVRTGEALCTLVTQWMSDLSPNWLLGWRDITGIEKIRTTISAIIPRMAVGHTLSLVLSSTQSTKRLAAFCGLLNSLVLDYVARQKVGGTHLTFGLLEQLPILQPERFGDSELAFLVPRILELTYTASDLKPWAQEMGYEGQPFAWDPYRRAILRAELDAYFARLYGLQRDELRYILDPTDVEGEDYPSETFRVLKNDELRAFGEYRTRTLVLEAWDRLAATHC